MNSSNDKSNANDNNNYYYSILDGGYDGEARAQMGELERAKEQSRTALELVTAKIEDLQKEQSLISQMLNEKENQLKELQMIDGNQATMKESVFQEHQVRLNDESQLQLGDDHEDEDKKIKQLKQETDNRLLEIQQAIRDKDMLLQSLQKDTQEQQETIHELQKVFEDLQSSSGTNLYQKLEEKETDVRDLEIQLSNIQKTLTDSEEAHLELEEEWNDREDLVADAEADATEKLAVLQKKLERYDSEISKRNKEQAEIRKATSERLETIRQDVLDVLTTDDCHTYMHAIQNSLQQLQTKEDELTNLLVCRLEERRKLLPTILQLEMLHQKCSHMTRKMHSLIDILDRKSRYSPESEACDIPLDQIVFLEENIVSGFEDALEELDIRLENLEQKVMDEAGESVAAATTALEKLRSTMTMKLRQMARSLPAMDTERSRRNTVAAVADQERRNSQRGLRLQALQSAISTKEDKLKRVEDELVQFESDDSSDSNQSLGEREKKQMSILEEELKVLTSGINEKERMIEAIQDITSERRQAEASLLNELRIVYKHNIIHDNDFGEEDRYLLKNINGSTL
jgi:DNA repair exonuclease SbcCD ATPase subunit